MVQSMKKTLKAILKDRRVHEDVLHTALVEVEAILNSRPLTNDQDGPYDLEPFNPNHLIRHHNRSVPVMRETHESDVSTRKKWRQSQWLAEHFWKRFRREYLSTLTVSNKWNTETRNLKVDDVVIIVDANAQRGLWPLARVAEILPGDARRSSCSTTMAP